VDSNLKQSYSVYRSEKNLRFVSLPFLLFFQTARTVSMKKRKLSPKVKPAATKSSSAAPAPQAAKSAAQATSSALSVEAKASEGQQLNLASIESFSKLVEAIRHKMPTVRKDDKPGNAVTAPTVSASSAVADAEKCGSSISAAVSESLSTVCRTNDDIKDAPGKFWLVQICPQVFLFVVTSSNACVVLKVKWPLYLVGGARAL